MIIAFDDLKKTEFSLSNINVILQRPVYRALTHKKPRIMNGFLYITEGSCVYRYEDKVLPLSPGAIIYLPLGSIHSMTVTSESIEFYRVNFTLSVEGERALFSQTPMLITESAPPECIEAIRALDEDYRVENNTVEKTEKMCRIFSSLQKSQLTSRAVKLSPAVRYIHEHLREEFDSRELASLCFLSTAQFYKLFGAEFGMTPLEYRSRLLIQRAVVYMCSNGISITETASMLGFESGSYFSRFFRRHTGESPREYIKNHSEA